MEEKVVFFVDRCNKYLPTRAKVSGFTEQIVELASCKNNILKTNIQTIGVLGCK